jgi:hypothetical protein
MCPACWAALSTTFGAYGIGIDSVLQLSKDVNDSREVPLVFILHEVTRTRLDEALDKIRRQSLPARSEASSGLCNPSADANQIQHIM